MEDTVKQHNNSKKRVIGVPFKKGQSGNPNGRPKGKTLKEYRAEKFRQMTDKEKDEFLRDVAKDLQWRMAEGNPHQTQENSHEGTITLQLSKEIAEKNDIDVSTQSTGDNS